MTALKVRLAGFVFAALAATGCGNQGNPSQPQNVFGEDARTELESTTFPGSAVGRLDIGCTGAMIGKRLAVTAAHCVVDEATGRLRADVSMFKAGLKGDRSVAESWIVAAWVGTLEPNTKRKDDWAVLLLADDIGTRTGWFGLRPLATETQLPYTVKSAGYGTDKDQGRRPMITTDCYVHKVDDQGRLLHDCDGVNGISGGPLFVQSGTNVTMVAVSVSELRRGDQSMILDSYSHELANIAVNVGAFYDLAAKLKPATDTGMSLPVVEGTHYLVNTSSNPAGGNSGSQSPGSGTTTGGSGTTTGGSDRAGESARSSDGWRALDPTPEERQSRLVAQVNGQANSITTEAGAILFQLTLVQNYAAAYGYSNLWSYAATLRAATEAVSISSWNLSQGAVDAAAGANSVVHFVHGANTSMNTFMEFFSASAVTNPRVPFDLSQSIAAMKVSMTRLIEMVSVQN